MSRVGAAALPRFAAVDGEVLESLYQHRLLSTPQVAELHMPDASRRTTQRILARLRAAKLADCTREPGGLALWYVRELGAEAVEAVPSRAETRRKLLRPEHAAGPLRHHTLAVNDVGIAFVRAAREREDDECGPLAWRHEVWHLLPKPPGRRQPDQLIADALLTYQLTEPDGSLSVHYRFVELDRATMPAADLADKLSRYARLYCYALPPGSRYDDPAPLWTQLYRVFPDVLVVLTNDSRPALERRCATVLGWAHDHPELLDCPQVEIAACLLDDLAEHGPFAPIFRTVADPKTPTNWIGEAERKAERDNDAGELGAQLAGSGA